MAMDLYSENPSTLSMSPRISFSHDLSPSDINFPVDQRLLRSISSSTTLDFDFCNQDSFNQQNSFSAADFLFLDGKLLPTDQLINKPVPKSQHPDLLSVPLNPDTHQTVSKCEKNGSNETPPPSCFDLNDDQKKKSKSSFWQFKRSSSTGNNNNSSYARSLCPIPLLSRSNSAGSATTSSKRSSSSKESNNNNHNHNKQQQHSHKTPLVSNSTKQSQFSSSSSYQKPPLKKNAYGSSSSSHGVRINPTLNVASANLFGLGSIFSTSSNKLEKNKK